MKEFIASLNINKIVFTTSYILSEFAVMIGVSKFSEIGVCAKIILFLFILMFNAIVIYTMQYLSNECEETAKYLDDDDFVLSLLNPQSTDLIFKGLPSDKLDVKELDDIKIKSKYFNDTYTANFIVRSLNNNVIKNLQIITVSTSPDYMFYISDDLSVTTPLSMLLTEDGLESIRKTESGFVDITVIMRDLLKQQYSNNTGIFIDYCESTKNYEIFFANVPTTT